MIAHLSGRHCAAGRSEAMNVEHLFHAAKLRLIIEISK
jgi:hypothetical protein